MATLQNFHCNGSNACSSQSMDILNLYSVLQNYVFKNRDIFSSGWWPQLKYCKEHLKSLPYQKPHFEGGERLAGGALMFYHLSPITDPTGRARQILWRSAFRKKKGFPFPLAKPQSMRNCHNSASEKPLYFELPSLLQWALCLSQSSQFPPLLSKRMFFSFVLHTCLWFCCSLLVPDCNSLLLLNKIYSAGLKKKNPLLIFKTGNPCSV